MTNSQTRMLSSAIGMVAGALAGFSNNLDVNVSIAIILGSLIWIFTDPRRRTIYDRAATTYVVRAR